jgi:hypothetical protein
MAAQDADRGARYWAFVSYSHKDAAFGHRLHRRLESYVLPRRIVGRKTAAGFVPKRLHPIFRDREEFAAAGDLSAEVRTALAGSRSLIVVCSPAAAASLWVKREVELFRLLHPDRPVLAAICEGEPGQSLPDALRGTDADGAAVEPLAADFRRSGDGVQLGLLKLVAGVLGVGLDELVQRDAHRRLQRVTTVTAAALVAMLGMGALTLFALNARNEAQRQRTEAEGFIDFMHSDLRPRLKGVGRLDLMTTVNQHALKYYGDEDLAALPPDSLERRARILNDIGEDDLALGQPDAAVAAFREASRTTATLLAADPNNPERIFDHAQSEYWIGYHNYTLNRFAAAKTAYENYKQLALRLVAVAPGNPKYLRELSYAERNLCGTAFKPPRDRREALRACAAALADMEAVAAKLGHSNEIDADIAQSHAWLGDAYRINGDNKNALAHRLVQEKITDRLIEADPKNMLYRSQWVALQRVLARMENEAGRPDEALTRLKQADRVLSGMIAFDPGNKDWVELRTKLDAEMKKIDRQHSKGVGR